MSIFIAILAFNVLVLNTNEGLSGFPLTALPLKHCTNLRLRDENYTAFVVLLWGGEGELFRRGEESEYFKYRPMRGAIVRRGHLIKVKGTLIRRFKVIKACTLILVVTCRPTTHDPRPTTHDPRPPTHDPRPTTWYPRPTTHDQ